MKITVAALATLLSLPVFAQTGAPTPKPHAHTVHHRAVKPPPASATASTTSTVKVWVNEKTGVYHYPGSRWYQATKNGVLMTEADAIRAGDRPAANGQ